jgi:hypothetical protein
MKPFVLWLVIAALLLPVLPSFAQDASGFSYQFEGLTLPQPASASPAAIRVASGQIGFQLAKDSLVLAGTIRCVPADRACVDGQTVAVTLGSTQGQLTVVDGTSNTIMFSELAVSGQTAVGQSFGPLSSRARGSLTCADEACQTLNLQLVACSSDGARQFGLVLSGSLAASGPVSGLMESEGISWSLWNNLGGTAYLTQANTPNPICGGRDLDLLYADDCQPGPLPSRTTDLPDLQLPETEGERLDQDLVIEATTARLTDQGLRIGVRGYFFGQCGIAPQARVWDDTDIVHVVIYRAIPDGTTCTGGVESFSLLLPYIEQDSVLKAGDRFPANINGQIIAILIGL